MKIIIIALCILVLTVPVLLLVVYKMQEKLIFFPEKLPDTHRFDFKEKFEEINFSTEENVSINALLFKADTSTGLILYFHGNAGSLQSWGEVAKDFLLFGYDVLLIDFRGYGKSSGTISREEELHHDASYVFNAMKEKYGNEKIIIYGRSLGTGLASRLSSVVKPKALILETPFYSLTDMAKTVFPVLPASLILKYTFENYVYLEKTSCPVFLIHGTKDEIVPYHSSTRLAALSENITLYTIESGTHNNLSEFPEYHEVLKKIIK